MIINSGENNPFDSLDKIASEMDSEKMSDTSSEIKESGNIYDKCSEFLEKTVLEIIKKSPTPSTQPQSIQEIIQVIDLTSAAKKQVSKLVGFNDLLKNEEPRTKEEKQHKLEQKTKQINELLKSGIGVLDNAIQEEMKKAIDEMTITKDTSRDVNKLIDYKTTNRSIYENPSCRFTFFTFKSMELDKIEAKSFNHLDELLPDAKERIRQLPIIFQNEMFDLILSQTYTLNHLKLIENHLKYFESISNLKDPSQIGLIFKLFEDSLLQNINDKTSTAVETRQKVVDLFALAENPEQIESLIQTLTHPGGKINPIAAQCLKHMIIKEPLSKQIDHLKTLRNSLPADFKSEISEWEKLSMLMKKDPQLFQLMITHYQNNAVVLDYFLSVVDQKNIDLTWFIQQLEKMPANLSGDIKKDLTNLTAQQFNLTISLWKKIGNEVTKGLLTNEQYVSVLTKLISLAEVKDYLLELLQNIPTDKSEILFQIINKTDVDELSSDIISKEISACGEAKLFDECVESHPSLSDLHQLFLKDPAIKNDLKKVFKMYLGKDVDTHTEKEFFLLMEGPYWSMISRLASLDAHTVSKILDSDKEFSSIEFLAMMARIYEISPLVGDYFLAFHEKYPNHSGLLSDLLYKTGTDSFEKLLRKQEPLIDDHVKQFLCYSDLSKEKLKELCNLYDLNPSFTALCLKIPAEKGKEIIKMIPDILEFTSPELINEWINDPVFLSNTVEFLSNHLNKSALALEKLTDIKKIESAKEWVSLFQFDKDEIIFSPQRRDFFDLALPLLHDPTLHVPPALMFEALMKIEKEFSADFTELMENYDKTFSDRVRNIFDVVQMGEIGLASLLCRNALMPNRVSKDIKEKVISNIGDVLDSTFVPFYQQFMKLDPKKDEKLLFWIENMTRNEHVITQEMSSLLKLHEQGEDKLVNEMLKELDPNKSTNAVIGLFQTVRKKITSGAMHNNVRRDTLVRCIKKGDTALASHIYAQKQAFWEVDQSEKRLTSSLRVQESLWNLADDYAPKEIPHSLEKYLKAILSSQVSEKECVLALGYLQYVIKQDSTQIDRLTVFKSADDLKDFVFNCNTINPREIILNAMPSKDEIENLSLIEKEKFIEYRASVALAKCIVTKRGSLNTALLPSLSEEIGKITSISPNSSFAKHLNHVFDDFTQHREEYTQVLQKLIDPAKDKQLASAEIIVRSITQKNAPVFLTKMDYLESVVSALLTKSRQGNNRGNCFAMQTMIFTESDHQGLIKSTEDYVELLSKGKLTRQAIGDEYPLIIDQELINKGWDNPLQSSRAYTIAQMGASLTYKETINLSFELLNPSGIIGEHIDSTEWNQSETIKNLTAPVLQKAIKSAFCVTLMKKVTVFYSLDFQVPSLNSRGAWILQNKDTEELIDSDDKYIELLKSCCQSTRLGLPEDFEDFEKTIFDNLEKFIDLPQNRSKIIHVNQEPDSTKLHPRWMCQTTGGKGFQIRKCYNDQPNFSYDCHLLNTSSEEGFLARLDTLIDRLPIQRVKEQTTTGFSKLPVGISSHACNLNIGTLLRKKTGSSIPVVDQMKKEGHRTLQQPITLQMAQELVSGISHQLKLNKFQEEKLLEYATLNQSYPKKLEFLTQNIGLWLTNWYANQDDYSLHVGDLDIVIKNILLKGQLKVPEVLVLFDSNWIAKDHNNVEYGYVFNLMSKSLTSVCIKGSTQESCAPTDFTDFVEITKAFN